MGIVFPAECDFVIGEGDQSVIGYGHAAGVAGEVIQYVLRATKRALDVDDPKIRWSGTVAIDT